MQPDLSALDRLLGDVAVEGEIARTARAVVYRVRAGENPPRALKVSLEPSDAEDLARFRHEVRLLSEARHPNVIEVHDFGVLPGGFPFLVLELLAGDDLAEVLRCRGWEAFWEASMQAAAGLAHIHRQGVVHMDIKPRNLGLAVDSQERIALKILDFGLAQATGGALDRHIRGTLAYTAPEVLLQDSYDHRADLYSLGMTLFELATGTLPSAGNDLDALCFHLEGELPDPMSLRPDMPPALGRILRRLLQRDPAERYPSAGRLLADLAQAAGRSMEAGTPVPARPTLLATRLIGRDQALDRLREELAAAAAGRGGALLIEGPEGSGKSRLLREFRLFASLGGARVGRGQGLADLSRPFSPFLEALGSLRIETPSALPRPPRDPDPHERYRLYREITVRIADGSAPGHPLVLLLDDLHLAGIESEDLLAFLAEELRGVPALVVGTRRLREEGGVEGLPILRLEPLDRIGTARLIDACLGTSGLHSSLYDRVFEHTEGSPGEVQQLLRDLVAETVLLDREGEWKLSLSALSRWAGSPSSAEAKDRQRISVLSAPLREVLDAAAVIANPFPLATLVEILATDPQVLYERLTELVKQGHLESLQEPSGTLYRFARPRLRQQLYTEVDTGRRTRLHVHLGEALEATLARSETPGLALAVAEHFWRGDERPRALPYLRRAAAEAAAVYGYTQAAGLYGRAAEAAGIETEEGAGLLASQGEALAAAGSYPQALRLYRDLLPSPCLDPAFRARLHLRQGRLQTRLGDHEAARRSHEAGLRELAGIEAAELEVDLLQGVAFALRDQGDWPAAFSAARSALARAGRRGLDRQRATLLNTLGMFSFGRGDWRRAGRLVRRGLWVADRAGDEGLCLTLRNNLGIIFWKTGDYEAALTHYRSNLAACERTNDLWGQLFALNNLGILECSRGRWQAARDPLAKSLELKRRLGLRDNEVLGRLNLGEVEEVLGNWSRAQRHYERALKLLEATPEHRERLAALAQLASLERKRGRGNEAEGLAREALDGAERSGDRDLLAQCHLQLGLLEKDRDNLETAAAHFGQALQLAESAGTQPVLARLHVSMADLSLRRADLPAAERYAAEARRRVEELGDRFALAKLLSVEARLAGARQDSDRAEQLFAEGAGLLEEMEAPYEHARSLYEWGLRTWNVNNALRRLRSALEGFERLGAETESRRTSGAIERIREQQRLGEGPGVNAVLYEVLKVVNSSLDLPEVLNRTMDLVLGRLGAERGMIVLENRLTKELEIAAVRNLGQEDADEGRKLSASVVRRVIERREPVLAVDAQTDGRFAGAESIIARHIVSILCVPLTIRHRPAGAIYIDHRKSRHLFGPADLDFLVAFADQAAIAIENARLFGELEAARQVLKEENESLRREVLSSHSLSSLIGRSPAIAELKQMIERAAKSPSTVLIRGESGTGKGLVARILHALSARRQAPFVHFNCAALPETLVESELFGHEKGAFTGASGQKPGRFELAHQGTIFLDEIGKVSRAVQAKLLRVVEDKEFERVGGTRTLRSDVRILAATNLDLEQAIARNEFHEDLFYRLNILPIVLPPLRYRKEDIPYLVEHFLAKIGRDLGRPAKDLDPAVLDLLCSHAWPGNVRQLEAAIHRAFVLSGDNTLTPADFAWIQEGSPRPLEPGSPSPAVSLSPGSYEVALDRYDRQLVSGALAQCQGKIRETARLLGIARNTLRAKMKKYGLQGVGE